MMEKKERQISLFPYRQLENQNSSQKNYIATISETFY